MDDVENAIKALVGAIPGVGSLIGGRWALKKLLGPSLDKAGVNIANLNSTRLKNLAGILGKTPAIAEDADLYPNARVLSRVLNDATLYDDDVMQTYVAGLLAGSRNDDGSDDRPIYYLTLIDGLTSQQMRVFHLAYQALAQTAILEPMDPGKVRIQLDLDEFIEKLPLFGKPARGRVNTALIGLEHAQLLGRIGIEEKPGRWLLKFNGTRTGAALYDWAHGLSETDHDGFFDRPRPNIGLPAITFKSLAGEPDIYGL